jgi:hypothetical protein
MLSICALVATTASAATIAPARMVVNATLMYCPPQLVREEAGSALRRCAAASDLELAPTAVAVAQRRPGEPHSLLLDGFEFVRLPRGAREAAARLARAGSGGGGGGGSASIMAQARLAAGGRGGLAVLRGSDDANIAAVAAALSSWHRLLSAPGAGPFERGLRGAALHLPLACGGPVLRRVAPLGAAEPGWSGPSVSVHVDQDLRGAPLAGMFGGALALALRALPALRLLGVWVAIGGEPRVRPLALLTSAVS